MAQTKSSHHRTVTANKIVTVDTIVTVKDRIIDFNDILDCITIEPDDEYRTPWEDCDGYEHEVHHVNARACKGRSNLANIYSKGAVLVEFSDSVEKDFTVVREFYHRAGASRQVAAELVARNRRHRMATLIGWLENGWEYYGVTGDYEGYHSSCWGIDDYDYADKFQRLECAYDIASQMEADGFIVENRPDRQNMPDYQRSQKIENFKYRLCHNAQMFNTEPR